MMKRIKKNKDQNWKWSKIKLNFQGKNKKNNQKNKKNSIKKMRSRLNKNI
jgi:hypothetical protein